MYKKVSQVNFKNILIFIKKINVQKPYNKIRDKRILIRVFAREKILRIFLSLNCKQPLS